MKKSILIPVVMIFTAFSVFTSCDSPATKVETAESDVAEAEADLVKAKEDYLQDVENFRMKTDEQIVTNNENIANYNALLVEEKKETRENYKMKISELEAKNRDLKMKMDAYNVESQSQWEAFKQDFNTEMNNLKAGIRDLTSKND